MLMVILTGCSDVYIYKGENENWTGEYRVIVTEEYKKKDDVVRYESNSEDAFNVTYKHKLSDLASVKKIEITYETKKTSGKLTQEFTDTPPKDRTFSMGGGSSGATLKKEDDTVKVTINIDGKIETFDLILE
jgi:hypothetical protein